MIENRSQPLLVVVAIFCATTVIATLLRCYVRVRMVKAFGLDDYFTVASLISFLWFASLVFGGIHYGTGRHMWDLSQDDAVQALRFWWLCYISYCTTMALVKIAIGLFFLRITVTTCQRTLVWFTIGLTILSSIIFFFVVVFQCTPVYFFWTKVIPGTSGTCLRPFVFSSLGYLYGSVCALCDIIFGLLPILLVWKLELAHSTKVMLVPILGMAAIASCAVFARMAYMKNLRDPDFLYATTDIAIWSVVEAGLAVTASSLATLRPLFRAFFGQLSSPSTRRASGTVNRLNTLPQRNASPKRPMGTFERLQATNNATQIEIWTSKKNPEPDVERADDETLINGEAANRSILVKTEIETRCDRSGESSPSSSFSPGRAL